MFIPCKLKQSEMWTVPDIIGKAQNNAHVDNDNNKNNSGRVNAMISL
jgi:hypothetical protein